MIIHIIFEFSYQLFSDHDESEAKTTWISTHPFSQVLCSFQVYFIVSVFIRRESNPDK